ncbi:MAG TPA: cytochrome b [Lamprocystis sp. (in: g-proteobacteria)]|nr:cytochrome b [Lamprocystis sp. (in: g-proteobacteria)]
MNASPVPQRYNLPSQLFHWTVALLILGLIVTDSLRGDAPKDSDLRTYWLHLHESLGVLVFLVVIARILWSRISTQPAPIDGPQWSLIAGKLTHGLLNLATLLIPISGYLRVVSKDGRIAEFFGIQLPSLVPASPQLNDAMHIFHGEPMEFFLYALVGLHVAAALWHQYARRDGTLERMLPWGRPNA